MWPSLARKSHGWPFNAYCYPPVVGPGDSTCFYMRQSIHSIKGDLRAEVKATAREDNGPEFPLAADSSDADWGTSIQAKSAEKTGTARLWVTLGVPDKPELAGKQIECQVDLTATFPVVDPNGNTFHVEHGQFQDRLTLQLGAPRAGHTYQTIWWCGAFGGMGLFLLSGLADRRCPAPAATGIADESVTRFRKRGTRERNKAEAG